MAAGVAAVARLDPVIDRPGSLGLDFAWASPAPWSACAAATIAWDPRHWRGAALGSALLADA